jgi:Flp pilus assembly protein TadG
VRLFRRSMRDEGGQAAVEFALVLPFLLILLVGIIEFGRGWNEHQVMTDAAREAARRAAIVTDPPTTKEQIENTAKAALAAAGIDPNRATITLENWDGDRDTLLRVKIDLRYRFTFFGPLVKWTTGESIIVLKTAIAMRNE